MKLAEKIPVSAVVLTRNNENMIAPVIESLAFCDEIVVVDHRSSDQTPAIATRLGARVNQIDFENFAQSRNVGLKAAKNDWILYVDSDEMVIEALRAEITQIVADNMPLTGRFRRRNWFLGREMYPDAVERLFHRTTLTGWVGRVHEHPLVTGETVDLKQPLIHHTHRSIEAMLNKTNQWSEIEADLRMEAKHPPVAGWRLIRIALTVWWRELAELKVWRYGRAGWFEGYFQMVDKLIVYIKLWERQHATTRAD